MKRISNHKGVAGEGKSFGAQGFTFDTSADFAAFDLTDGRAMADMFNAQIKVMLSLGVEDMFTAWYALALICANSGFEGLLRDLSIPCATFSRMRSLTLART